MLGGHKNMQQSHTSAWVQCFEIEMAVEKLNRHKSSGIEQFPAEFI
jgi:hypothetical protein